MTKKAWFAVTLIGGCAVAGISSLAQPLEQVEADASRETHADNLLKDLPVTGAPKSTQEWLDSTSTRIHVRRTEDAIIYYSDFVRSDKLNKGVMEFLNDGPLLVEYPYHDEQEQELLPIELVELAANENRLSDCTMMIQLARLSNAKKLDPKTERLLTGLREKLPAHPLGENCEKLDPWKGLEQSREKLIELNGSTAIYFQGHLTVIDTKLSCSQFAEEQSGSFEITQQTKAIVRSYSNRMPTHLRDSYRTSRIATIFEGGLKDGISRSGQPPIQMLANDYLADAPDIIRVDYSIIDDDEADAFCFVSEITQGSAHRTDVLVTPRDGLKAEWTEFVDSRPAWKGLGASRDFGRAVGDRVSAQAKRPKSPTFGK